MILDIENIKTSDYYLKYLKAKQDFDDVSKGGKDYANCSFMDIAVRDERLENRKKELIEMLGNLVFDELKKEK
mgnify:FL=1